MLLLDFFFHFSGLAMPKQLSGAAWCSKFPDAGTISALAPPFRAGCEAFVAALRAAGASVAINSTRRPEERAFLMHYSWRIHKRTLNPQNVPAKAGIDIEWVHRDASGAIDLNKSRATATAMVNGYGIAYQPALRSHHVSGKAIDMDVSWTGTLEVARKDGTIVAIGAPRTGLNSALWPVGRTYGVVKHPSDRPHWSVDGR